MIQALNTSRMLEALRLLDARLQSPTRLVVGGGAALALAYRFPLTTQDVDAFTAKGGVSMAELDRAAKEIATTLAIPTDWLNAHFVTFTHVLPSDYADRLRSVYRGATLSVEALGPEDLLIMKCFAGREKDRIHARHLVKLADLDMVARELDELIRKRIPGASQAADFLDDIRDEVDV